MVIPIILSSMARGFGIAVAAVGRTIGGGVKLAGRGFRGIGRGFRRGGRPEGQFKMALTEEQIRRREELLRRRQERSEGKAPLTGFQKFDRKAEAMKEKVAKNNKKPPGKNWG